MTEATRRDRVRADTDRAIRAQARALLVDHGPQAVTLRAIAREMGITAPALYRYYASREDLVEHLRTDVCEDLAQELADDLARLDGDDRLDQVLAICRGFRRWALAHPQEFVLVFASPSEASSNCPAGPGGEDLSKDSFGRIFLSVAGRVLASGPLVVPPEPTIPPSLRPDLALFREELLRVVAESGVELPPERLSVATAFVMLQFWVRLYGQVALEVFGQFPFPVGDPEPLFESMLTDLLREAGL
jgi:AcrR family transcriptional regulator